MNALALVFVSHCVYPEISGEVVERAGVFSKVLASKMANAV